MAGGVTIPRKNLGESLGFSFVPEFVFHYFRNVGNVGIGLSSKPEFRGYVALGGKHVYRLSSILYEVQEREKIGIPAEKHHFVVIVARYCRVYGEFDVEVALFQETWFSGMVQNDFAVFVPDGYPFERLFPNLETEFLFQIRSETVDGVYVVFRSTGPFFRIREVDFPYADFAAEPFPEVRDEFFEIQNRLGRLIRGPKVRVIYEERYAFYHASYGY